jgi:hypothetical protein
VFETDVSRIPIGPTFNNYVVVTLELVWSSDAENYAGGSVATSGVSRAGQVKEDDSYHKRYRGPPGWELGLITTPP